MREITIKESEVVVGGNWPDIPDAYEIITGGNLNQDLHKGLSNVTTELYWAAVENPDQIATAIQSLTLSIMVGC